MGHKQRVGAPGLYSLERLEEKSDLMQAFKTITGLHEIQGRREVLFQIGGTERQIFNGKTIARENATFLLTSKSLAIRVVNSCNKLPEKVVEVESMREFIGGLDSLWFGVFGENDVG